MRSEGRRTGGVLSILALGTLLQPFALSGQQAVQAPTLAVGRSERDLSAGDFDDPAWEQAPSAGQPVQQEPVEGEPPTLRTDCRVIATPSALLVRFVMEEPAFEIVARELRRDADLSADDRINFILDTYHDHRNAYYFATNPNGVRVDGLITEEQRNTEDGLPSLDWDTVWDLRVRRTLTGWDALFRIPYASLNFPGETNGIWGFNFARNIRRRTETDRWSGWRRPYTLTKVSLAGNLLRLPALSARRLRQLAPYAAGALDHRADPSDTDLLGKAGLDFRYGVSSAVEAGLTVNTDFAETEADPQQFNFGRTSLFFPEKRSFFLQRSQIFAFGTQSTTLPFFSRTIGLKTNVNTDVSVPIPIDAGLKLSGKLGMTDFGVLGVQTRAGSDEPRTDFLAGRFKEDLGHASYVGGLFTDIER
ncbi:MAG TPA: DUF5916 domain-containing protein, partial [Thermoanaerobaculia bacterium]|nr:DUF5916 domain-containing protein [Thermoanaerobaculia bacterium]